MIDADNERRYVVGERERLGADGAQARVDDEDLGPAVVEHVRDLARREPEVDRRSDRAEALRGEPDERELGAVEQVEDDHVLGSHAVRGEACGEPAGVLPELRVGPAAAAQGIVQRRTGGEAEAVALDPGEVAELLLEDLLELVRVVPILRGAAQTISSCDQIASASDPSRLTASASLWTCSSGREPSGSSRISLTPTRV